MAVALDAPSVDALCGALRTTGASLSAMMREVRDPTPTAIGHWSIGETAAHVSGSAAVFADTVRGEVAPHPLGDVDAANARWLAKSPERDPRLLADRLEAGDDALCLLAEQAGGDPLVVPFEGLEVPLSTVLAIELGELLVHGHDIATAAGLEWRIQRDDARLTLQGYLPLLPFMLDAERARGVRLAVELRVRGVQPVGVSVDEGRLVVEDARGLRVDAHLAATAEDYLLLMWNRVPVWRPLLRGHLLVWGRRPWRAAEFSSLMAT